MKHSPPKVALIVFSSDTLNETFFDLKLVAGAERLNMAQNLLETTDLSIEQIAEEVGFSSVLTFREKFKQKFFVTPKQWRKTFHER